MAIPRRVTVMDSVNHPMEVLIPAFICPDRLNHHVVITVICDNGHVVGQWANVIEEKYPFYCDQCDDQLNGSYPWQIVTRIEYPRDSED
jgi:hypothetical protein